MQSGHAETDRATEQMFLVNGSSRWEYSGVKCVRTSGKAKVVPRVVTHNHFTDDKTETYKEVKYIFTKAGLLFLNVEFFTHLYVT